MRATRTNETSLVIAARAGDRRALDELITKYLPLVYNLVGRALNEHSDVDDVVQETMLRALRELTALRTPESFRPWLVAIAVRQVSTHRYRHRAVAARTAALDEAVDVPDADFEDLTILQLGLSGQRRQVARASQWLDPDDRVLLSLWWLETMGHLTRTELAAAIGVTVAHASTRLQRMRHQLELSRSLVAALDAKPRCARLSAAVARWDGRPTPLWRKRVARHLRSCTVCARTSEGMVPPERLLVGLALVPVPLALTAALLARGPLPAAAGVAGAAALSGATALSGAAGGAGAAAKAGILGQLVQAVWAHPVAAAIAAGALVAGATAAKTTWPTSPSQPPAVVEAPTAAPTLAHPTQATASMPPSPTVTRPSPLTASLPLGPVSLESMDQPGRFVAYVNDVGGLAPVGADASAAARQQATFDVVAGLSDAACISLRARDGRYLRHSNWRLLLNVNNGTTLFRGDATFCARAGSAPGSVSLESSNYPGRYLRHVGDALWVDPADGTVAFRASSSFRVRPALAG